MEYPLNSQLADWLSQHALELDQSNQRAPEVLPQLAAAELLGLGVPTELGGIAQSRFSDTASIQLDQCVLTSEQLLADDAQKFIQKIRPQFLSLQSALSTGVALRSVEQIHQALSSHTAPELTLCPA